MHTDTPPSSPDMANQVDDEDMIYIGDVEEVIDAYDAGDIEEEDAMEEDPSEEGDAICVFSSHEIGKEHYCCYNQIYVSMIDCDFL